MVEEAERTGSPLRQLALSLAVHLAPRRLRLGKAISFPILEIGQSILAGCKRSTHLASVYTVTAIKELDAEHEHVSIGQHVDDISNLTVASTEDELVGRAVRYAVHFAAIMRQLCMTISNKSVVVPSSRAALRIAKILQGLGIPMKCESVGVDIGVDASSASSRTTFRQQERLDAGSNNARRCETLSKKNAGVRRVAITGIEPTQDYGFTAVGMAPSSINKAKTNIARATGLMAAGTCASSVLRWAFRKGRFTTDSADPRVSIPTRQVKSWTDLWNRLMMPRRKESREPG